MDNRSNSDKDKVLDDILNGIDNETYGQKLSRTSNNRNYSPGKSARHISGKTVNPSALSESNNSTTGFAVSKMPEKAPVNEESKAEAEYQEQHIFSTVDVNTSKLNEEYADVREKESRNIYNTNNIRKTPRNTSKNNKHSKKKKRSARLPLVLMLTTIILTIAISLSIVIIAVGRDMLAIGKQGSLKMVTIEEGADAAAVARILEEEGIIDVPKAFEIVAKMGNVENSFIPGQYELSPGYAYAKIINKLTTEEDEEAKEAVTVTFIEGTSILDAAKILEENGVCSAERFIYYFNAGGFGFDFENQLPTSTASKFYRMEGYLFPDTYRFYKDSEPESVCMKIYQNFEDKMSDKYYEQMKKKNMTLDEVITLASIVQAEAHDAKSMKKVAAVFENRLANADDFPKLESDPTTYYVEEIIKPNIEVKSNAIFEAYDTYKEHGLPPGAIGNPGIDAIEAVLFHAESNDYYFCADIDTKEIFYAETLEEHEENLARINGEYTEDGEDGEDDYSDDEEY